MHPLGGRRIVDSPDGIGYGRDRPELWIMPRATAAAAARRPRRGSAGRHGRRRGTATSRSPPPGAARSTPPTRPASPPAAATAARPRRAQYGPPNYYAAYLVDPDGAWLELVERFAVARRLRAAERRRAVRGSLRPLLDRHHRKD